MADTKISQMPSAATLDGTEIVPLVQTGDNVQTDLSTFVNETIQADPSTARSSLGLGTMATQDSTNVSISGGTVAASTIFGTLAATHGGTGLSAYATGDIIYASNTNVLSKLSGNTTTTDKFLRQTGTGSVSTAPAWDIINPSDINTQYGAFHYDYTTQVSAPGIDSNVTTVPVTSTTGFSSTGAFVVGNEIVTYTGITSNSFTGCTRGAKGSKAVSHATGAYVGGAQVVTANTVTDVQINTVDISNGVTLNTSTNEISVAIAGTYNIQFSAQLFNSTTSQDLTPIWYELDGVAVPSSASWGTVPSRINADTPASALMTVNLFLTLTTSNKLKLKWLSQSGNAVMVTYPQSVSPLYPSAPAIIVTVNQVS